MKLNKKEENEDRTQTKQECIQKQILDKEKSHKKGIKEKNETNRKKMFSVGSNSILSYWYKFRVNSIKKLKNNFG